MVGPLKKILTIGIIGGGQLGRMTCFYAHKMGFRTVVFTDQANSPASFVTNEVIIADYSDQSALKKFAAKVDIGNYSRIFDVIANAIMCTHNIIESKFCGFLVGHF